MKNYTITSTVTYKVLLKPIAEPMKSLEMRMLLQMLVNLKKTFKEGELSTMQPALTKLVKKKETQNKAKCFQYFKFTFKTNNFFLSLIDELLDELREESRLKCHGPVTRKTTQI